MIERIQTVQLQLESDSDHTQLQDKVVDIDSLVEECFSENAVPCYKLSANVNSSVWTFEEEIKIYELLVKKEMFLDTFF